MKHETKDVVSMMLEKLKIEYDFEKVFHYSMLKCNKEVLVEFKDVFPTDFSQGLPLIQESHEFHIDPKDKITIVHMPIYKLSSLELEEAQNQLLHAFDHGYIQPLNLPYRSLVLLILKKDRGLWFCIDYHCLNKKTICNWYPLSLFEELCDCLGCSKAFRKIDLRSGYWQVPHREEDILKIVLKTCWGLYEFMVVPFRVNQCPSMVYEHDE